MATQYSVSVLLKLIDQLTNPLGKISDKMMRFSDRLRKVGEKMAQAGKKMTLMVTAPLALLGKQAIQTAGEFEKNQIALESMLGSAEKAKVLLQDLVEFSAKTPFQLPGLIEGTKQLLAFGIPADDIIEKLQNLGNIAQGDQGKLTGLVQAFGKIRAKGVASMRELNMMINAGVPIMRALSEEFGVAEAEIFEMSRRGELTFDRIDKAITNLTTGTGMFAGILEKQSQSLLGLWSTLLDNFSLLGKEIAETFMPALKGLINGVMGIVKWFRSLSEGTKHLIGIIIALTAAIGPLMIVLGKLFILIATGMGPIGLILAGLAALAAAIIGVAVAIDRHNNRFRIAAQRYRDQKERVSDLADEYEALQKKTNRTREEQDRFLSLQRQLKTAIGDNAFVLNEMTGELELNRKEFERWSEELRILEVKNLQRDLEKLEKRLQKQIKTTEWARKEVAEAKKEGPHMWGPEVYEAQLEKSLKAELAIESQIETTKSLIEEIMKGMIGMEDFAEEEEKIKTETEETNKELKTMADLLDEIDQKMKQRIVGELLRGKRERFFRTTDVIKRFEKMQKESKSKVDVSIKVEAEEGTSAKISKVEKSGEEADVSIEAKSYIGMHQFTM
jgi:tape measure domain-containing protein